MRGIITKLNGKTRYPVLGYFVGRVSTIELGYAVIPAMIATFLFVFNPQLYMVIPIVLTLSVSIFLLRLTPEEKKFTEHVKDIYSFYRNPNELRLRHPNDEEKIDRRWFEEDGDTKELPMLQKVHTDLGAVERSDGAMVKAIEVRPPNLEQKGDEIVQAAEQYEEFLQNHLDFKVTLYLTTRTFDTQRHVENYRYSGSRFEEAREMFEVNGESMWDSYPVQYESFIMQNYGQKPIRRFYMLIPVEESEVEDTGGPQTISEGISEWPLIGRLFSSNSDSVDDIKRPQTTSEIRVEQVEKIDERINRIRKNLIGKYTENNAGIYELSANEQSALIKEFWEGKSLNQMSPEEVVNNSPVIGQNQGDNNER